MDIQSAGVEMAARDEMTVCIGVLCESHKVAILVADRMVTSGLSIQFEHPIRNKVAPLSETCVALSSGDALATSELIRDVKAAVANRRFTGVEEFVEIVKGTFQNLRRRQIVERILLPRAFENFDAFYHAAASRLPEAIVIPIFSEIERYQYGLEALIGGVDPQGGAHLYGVTDPGTSICFDAIGFHAIGSGLNLALGSLISDHCNEEMPMAEALLCAVRAKTAAENAPGVGNLTDVTIISSSGTLILTDAQIKALKQLAASEIAITRVAPKNVMDVVFADSTKTELQASENRDTVGSPAEPSAAVEVSDVQRPAKDANDDRQGHTANDSAGNKGESSVGDRQA